MGGSTGEKKDPEKKMKALCQIRKQNQWGVLHDPKGPYATNNNRDRYICESNKCLIVKNIITIEILIFLIVL